MERPVLRVVVPGPAGKMGRQVVRVLAETPGVRLAGAIQRPGHPALGQDAGTVAGVGPLEVPIGADLGAALGTADVVIDFTTATATAELAGACAERGVALVVGTTGLGAVEREAVTRAAERVPVVLSPNMSVGVNVLFGLLAVAARALGESYDVELAELHHRAKRDAPSGTALEMARVLAEALGRDLGRAGVYGRHGDVGARSTEEIGVMALRGGDVVGEHTAYFLGRGERLEISHRASSREIFARGAVRAALWLAGKAPALYDMQDVLGLRG
jgi:4-hydroxy-tetrahydrodipicolinate reductase